MRDCLSDRFHQYEAVFFKNAAATIEYLKQHLRNTILISLDHDLELMPGPHGQLLDQGTGREVADYLTGQPPGCPIVIHSTNSAAAIGMRTILQEAGWTVHRVVPFNDLEWIAAEWFPTVRRALWAQPEESASSLTGLEIMSELHVKPLLDHRLSLTRRAFFGRTATGIGTAALATLLSDDLRADGLPHRVAKAKASST